MKMIFLNLIMKMDGFKMHGVLFYSHKNILPFFPVFICCCVLVSICTAPFVLLSACPVMSSGTAFSIDTHILISDILKCTFKWQSWQCYCSLPLCSLLHYWLVCLFQCFFLPSPLNSDVLPCFAFTLCYFFSHFFCLYHFPSFLEAC